MRNDLEISFDVYSDEDGVNQVDLLIDEIYTTITTFMPQLSLERKDIKITNDGINIFAQVSCIYLLDRTANLYTIRLTSDSEDSEIQRGE